MTRQRDQIEQLEQLLSGTVAPEDAPRDVAHLGSLATALRDTVEVERPDPATRAAIRENLLEAIQAEQVTWWTRLRERIDAATARWRHSARVAIASATASTMIGTAGVAAAAQSALPGDLLYDIKLWTEDARLVFANGDAAQGRLHLLFARERLDEITEGIDRLDDDTLTTAFTRMDAEAATGAEHLLAAALGEDDVAASELLDELTTFATEQASGIAVLLDDLPLGAVGAAEDSLEVLRRIAVQIDSLRSPGATCGVCGAADLASVGITPPRIVLPAEGPAVPPVGCSCVDPAGDTTPGEPDGDSAAGDTPTVEDPATQDPVDTDPSQDVLVGNLLGDIVGDTTDTVDDVIDDTTDTVDDVIDDTTDTVGDVVEDPTGTVGDVVEDPTGTVGDVIDDTTETVDDVIDDTTETVGDVVDDTTDSVGDVVDDTTSDGGVLDGLLGG